MLKGIANLTPVFWDLTGTVNHLLNLTQLHLFILQVLANLIVNIAGMAQNEVFVSSPELLTLGFLVSLSHLFPCFLSVSRKYGNKALSYLTFKNERINQLHLTLKNPSRTVRVRYLLLVWFLKLKTRSILKDFVIYI